MANLAKDPAVDHQLAALTELERYRLLIDNIRDYAVYLMDPQGRIVTWNKGAQEFKGYRPEEVIGKHVSVFYTPEDIAAGKPGRELELAHKLGRVEDEDWRVRKDGGRFWANVVIAPLYGQNGQLIGYAKVTRDLTERKAQEDALRQANTRLKRQQRELERLNVAKDEFISLASHQLRTPVTVIKQLLGMLLEGVYGDVPDDIKKVVDKAYTSNERQLHIVNSLLRTAQIDAGRVVIRKLAVDLNQMIRLIGEEYHDISKARQHRLHTETAHREPLIVPVDVENLRMAVSNLMDNALKYTPDGGEIKLGVRRTAGRVEIFVSDNGVGIEPADVVKLFGKFVRIPNAMSQQVGGSGLGLYWVRKVVELHDGRVEVESQAGAGTTFTIVLPDKTS